MQQCCAVLYLETTEQQIYVSEWNFRAENESEFKNFPSRHVVEKIGVATLKKAFLALFWKIVELNHDVLQTSLISKIKSWNKLFQMKAEKILTYLHQLPGIIKCAVLLKVLRVAEYEYASKWRIQYGRPLFQNLIIFAWNLLLQGYKGRWLRICSYI